LIVFKTAGAVSVRCNRGGIADEIYIIISYYQLIAKGMFQSKAGTVTCPT
jgi:hypothetical protein